MPGKATLNRMLTLMGGSICRNPPAAIRHRSDLKLNAKRVLVVTFKPAVEDAWQSDLESHVDFDGWQYLSKSSGGDPTQIRSEAECQAGARGDVQARGRGCLAKRP